MQWRHAHREHINVIIIVQNWSAGTTSCPTFFRDMCDYVTNFAEADNAKNFQDDMLSLLRFGQFGQKKTSGQKKEMIADLHYSAVSKRPGGF